MSILIFGCVDSKDGGAGRLEDSALVSPEAWEQAYASGGPLALDRPPDLACDGVVVENGVLEIDTGRCPYFASRQGSRIPLNRHDWLKITIYHDHLFAQPPAEGRLALFLDEALVWETRVPIPSEANLFTEYVQLNRAYPRGTRVDFHLHNHGLNHWRLVSLERSTGP